MEKKDEVLITRTQKSASSSSSSTTTPSPRTPPNCARCSNHRLQIRLKGHKRYCKYRNCKCPECKLTAARQRVMAKQTMRRRALAQDENKIRVADEVDPPPFGMESDNLSAVLQPARSLEGSYDSSSGDSPISNHDENGMPTGLGGAIAITASRKVTSSHPHAGAPSHLPQCQFGGSPEFLLLYTIKLMELFRCPWEMLTYMYVILRGANGNMQVAMDRILQGIYEIRTLPFWTELGMPQTSRYCCTGYTDPTEAPTYEGQVPYIGVTPPSSAIDSGLHSYTLNSHIPATRVPFRSESLPEHSTSIDRLPTSR